MAKERTNKKKINKERRHILGLVVEDHPGVLQRLSGMFVRRGFNIETIIVGKTAINFTSHIIISLTADQATLGQLERQVSKIIEVEKVVDLSKNSVVREHCLAKVNMNPKTKQKIISFAKKIGANVLYLGKDSSILEIFSEPEKIDEIVKELKEFGVKELSRSGVNAMAK